MVKRKYGRLAILSMVGILGGCGSMGEKNFSCPGMPDGITCADPITIYEYSDDVENLDKLRKTQAQMKEEREKREREEKGDQYDPLNEEDFGIARGGSAGGSSSSSSDDEEKEVRSLYVEDDAQPGDLVKVTTVKKGKKTSAVYQAYINQKQLIVAPESPMPILQPADVARIWIAPWTDQNQDLHWPGYVFTEVTPRRWAFGESAVGAIRPTLPVLIDNGHKARLDSRKRNAGRRYRSSRQAPTAYEQSQYGNYSRPVPAATAGSRATTPQSAVAARVPSPPPGRNTFNGPPPPPKASELQR